MSESAPLLTVVRADDPAVVALLEALTAELADSGYAPEQTFGYSAEQLLARGVHLVGAWVDDRLVGVGGVEIDGAAAELKRFFTVPEFRGLGVADAVLDALLTHAQAAGAGVVRLETGDQQVAAMRFYRRHGFVEIPRFGPYVDSATSVCFQRRLGSDVGAD